MTEAQQTLSTVRLARIAAPDRSRGGPGQILACRRGSRRREVLTIGRVDNARQSERLMMVLALTVRLGSFDTLPMAGTRRGDSERDGVGARQRTHASGSWARFEPHISRAGMDYAKPHCARITLDALTRVLIGWRRYCDAGLCAARPS